MFLEVVPVFVYPIHGTQYAVVGLQFVGSTINDARKFTAARAGSEPPTLPAITPVVKARLTRGILTEVAGECT